MSGTDDTLPATGSIGLTDREAIRTAIAGGDTVTITMMDAGGDRAPSYRWLMGEKSEAFGGAIRDMWTPTCYVDPGTRSEERRVGKECARTGRSRCSRSH